MNWKKLASLGVVAMMSLSILGCGSDSASNTSSGDSSSISGSVTGSGSSALLPLAKMQLINLRNFIRKFPLH